MLKCQKSFRRKIGFLIFVLNAAIFFPLNMCFQSARIFLSVHPFQTFEHTQVGRQVGRDKYHIGSKRYGHPYLRQMVRFQKVWPMTHSLEGRWQGHINYCSASLVSFFSSRLIGEEGKHANHLTTWPNQYGNFYLVILAQTVAY